MQQVLVGGWKIAAMAVSAVIALGLPIFLLIFWRRKTGAKWTSALCGALIFVVFVYGLENALHQLCIYGQTPISAFLKNNTWAYMLYAGLAAGVFEETGRLVAFKLLLRKRKEPRESVMYGIGHGGMEAVLVCTMSMIVNIAFSVSINQSGLDALLASVPESGRAALSATAENLMSMPAGIFLVSGVERIIAVCLHIALSVLVFASVWSAGKGWLYPVAILIHAGVDCFAVLYSLKILPNMLVIETGVAILTGLTALFAFRVYRSIKSENTPPPVSE